MCILPILVGAILGVVATSHEKNTKAKQQEIDHLKRKLRHERRRRTPSISNFSSGDEEDGSYRQRSRTPPSKSFSYDKDYHHEHRNRSLSSKGLGNDAMSRALKQISRSHFTHRIEEGRLPQQFTFLNILSLTLCRGQKSFSFQQMRFLLGWGPKPKLDDELKVRPKGYW